MSRLARTVAALVLILVGLKGLGVFDWLCLFETCRGHR